MKMVHIRSIIGSLLILLLLTCMVSSAFAAVSSEDGYGSSKEQYKGPYDLSADHAVNLYYNDDISVIAELQEILYQEFLYWGMTPEGSAAVVGNILCESGYDPTRTQNNVPWSEFKWGKTGLGLIQWTYFSLQADLLNTAYRMGRAWTDMSVQFEAMKHHFGPDDRGSAKLYESGHTLYELTDWFLEVKENPAVYNYETRRYAAQSTYDRCSSLPAKHYDGSYDVLMSNASSGETGGSAEEYVPEELKDIAYNGDWELMGMPSASGLSKSVLVVSFPEAIKDYNVSHNIAVIWDDISSRNNLDTWKFARSVIVFVGMALVVYSIFMLCAVILDNVNNFIDVSFVSLISFGALKYTNDPTLMENPKQYASTKRMVVVIAVLFAVGAFCISGGVFSYLLKAVYWVNNALKG